MKTLTTGLLVFVVWSAASTYFYVCKIKDLCCDQPEKTVVSVKKEPPKKAAVTAPLAVPDSLILYYEFNDTTFIPESELESYALRAKIYMEQYPDKKLHITGNTDAIGSEQFNLKLGMKRAVNAEKYFIGKGIDKDRIIVESDAKDEPVASNRTKKGRAENRRVRIYIQ